MIRCVTVALSVMAIAVGQAQAQQGALRPSQCAPNLGFKATLMVHGNPAPNFPVVLSTLGGNASNARWHLEPVGDRFSVVSFFTQYGTVAMTVTGGGAQGSAIIVSPWTRSAEQLWTVNTDGSNSTFAWGNGLYLRTGACRGAQPLVLGPATGNLSWVWQ